MADAELAEGESGTRHAAAGLDIGGESWRYLLTLARLPTPRSGPGLQDTMTSLLPGTPVRARNLEWEVVDVEPAGEQMRYRLRCAQGWMRGRELDILSPFECVEPVAREIAPDRAGRLADFRLYHQAFLLEQALGPAALAAVQPGRLQIAPFQLVPVMRALQMSRPRLLLADGVGLGKTVEAGLILTELIARRRAHRVLIVSPAGPLLDQWQTEMRTRFGLRFEALRDWGALQEKRRELVLGANPFDHASYCLTSIDFAKQEKVLQELERASWDVVVIDEAHHVVSLGSAGDSEDSRRRRLAEVLARRADALLLLTATPHDGYDEHFASIVELLDPSLVDGRGALRGDRYRRHVVRRLKSHLKDPATGAPLFHAREVTPQPVDLSPTSNPRFAAFQEALLALVAPRIGKARKDRQYAEVLALIALLKRSVSTARAAAETLDAIAARYEELLRIGPEAQEARRQRLRTLRDYRRRLERYGSLSFEEERDQCVLEAEDIAADLRDLPPRRLLEKLGEIEAQVARERKRTRRKLEGADDTLAALRRLAELAREATVEDPKLAAVVGALVEIRAAEPAANVLVYTEYTDSQAALLEHLAAARASGELTGEVVAICGEDSEATRSAITARFSSEDGLVLVSTDATAEGLNLHARCHHLVHLELPYNPNRLEQRNGRIDRYGQAEVPRVRYLYLAGTFEERLLLRLVAKYERQQARLTFVPNTLGLVSSGAVLTDVRLLDGLAEEEGKLFERDQRVLSFQSAEAEDTSSPAYRDLLSEIDRAVAGFEKAARTHAWLTEVGSAADARLLTEAVEAHARGASLGSVDLVRFVCDALVAEVGASDAVRRESDGTLALTLPPSWAPGLEDLPGFETESRTLRLSTDAARVRDDAGRTIGFLGRAHPVVRRALERVRNLRYQVRGQLDQRVSAARSEGEVPQILCTFLGTVRSAAGRELERVLAVRLGAVGRSEVLLEPAKWESLADPERAIPTAGLWAKLFGSWAPARLETALAAASRAFEPLADELVGTLKQSLTQERTELGDWLRERASEVTGRADATTGDLFAPVPEPASWRSSKNPVERLTGLAGETTQPPTLRREADGVLRLYYARMNDIDRRLQIEVLAPTLLGLLMLVPDGRPI